MQRYRGQRGQKRGTCLVPLARTDCAGSDRNPPPDQVNIQASPLDLSVQVDVHLVEWNSVIRGMQMPGLTHSIK